MSTRVAASLLAVIFVLTVLQLVAFLVGPVTGVVCGAVIAGASALLLRFFQVELEAEWPKVAVPVGSSLLAATVVFFAATNRNPMVWLAGVVAAFVSLGIVGIGHLHSRKCELCNRRLGREVAFSCPRCGMLVCDRCWRFELSRCQLCEQNRVPIMTPDGRWWDKQLGPRVKYGRCQLCMVPAEEGDLRPCRNCGRPQCRDCWDTANGQCSRCKWTIEDLPKTLRPYVSTASTAEAPGSRTGR
jgi:hypothetical protein